MDVGVIELGIVLHFIEGVSHLVNGGKNARSQIVFMIMGGNPGIDAGNSRCKRVLAFFENTMIEIITKDIQKIA